MNGTLFYAVAIGCMFGILLASFGWASVWMVVCALGTVISLFVLYALRRDAVFLVSALFICALCVGVGRHVFLEQSVDHSLARYEDKKVEITGVVVTEPNHRERTTLLTVDVREVDSTPATGRVLVSHSRHSDINYGDVVRAQGTLTAPQSFETELGRTFDYPGYLKARGVHMTMSFATVNREDQGHGNPLIAELFTLKSRLSESISGALLAPESGLALGLLLGEKHALGKEVQQSFRDTGLIHIVVLSGYNIAIVIAAVMTLLSMVRVRTRIVLGGLSIILFVLMVGPSATVLRAAVMALLILLAKATHHTYAVMRALMVAAIGMLLVNPYLLVFDPGFQLSFLATLGLIVLAPHIESWFKRVPIGTSIKEYATATISTQIMVTPLLVYAMGTFSLVSLIANIAVLPVVPLAMLLSFLAGAFGMVSDSLGVLAGYPADLVLAYMLAVTHILARIPLAAFEVPPFPFWYVIMVYAGIVVILIALSTSKVARHTIRPHTEPNTHQSSGDIFRY